MHETIFLVGGEHLSLMIDSVRSWTDDAKSVKSITVRTVADTYSGLNIIKYSDGPVRKVMMR